MSAPAVMTKDDSQGSGGGRKSNSATAGRQLEQGLKCPRCDSANTKFCYYNNYSLTQPRYFCKTCRRYWTKGGALRNVPIGGGCRKNKKLKSSSSSSRLSNDGGFSPSLNFHLGGGATAASFLPFPRLNDHHPPAFNLEGTSSSFNIGFNNYPLNGGVIQGMSSMNIQSSLASSIESLSSINQDLHWKLQQQRLAMLFGGDSTTAAAASSLKDINRPVSAINLENQSHHDHQKSVPHPILFQNLEISKPEEICPGVGNSRRDTATEWFFGSSYDSVTPTPTTTSSGGGGGNGNDNNGSSNWSLQAGWGDVQQQYSSLP